MPEEWRKVPGFHCEASTHGRVRGPTGTILRGHDNGWGYLQIGVRREGARRGKSVSAHRMVALAFVPNPDGKRVGVLQPHFLSAMKMASRGEALTPHGRKS